MAYFIRGCFLFYAESTVHYLLGVVGHRAKSKNQTKQKMKSPFVKLSLVLVVVAGAVFALHSQPSGPPPSRAFDTYGNDGRYRLLITPNGMECVIDTQSGRVWHSTLDAQRNMIVFVSFTYENIDGDLSTIPNENATSVVSKSQPKKDDAK
jgi:hypothetical protein